MPTELLLAATANGSSPGTKFKGGSAIIDAGGTWDGANVTFQVRNHANTGWKDIEDANGVVQFDGTSSVPVQVYLGECEVRATLASVGASTVITAVIKPSYR